MADCLFCRIVAGEIPAQIVKRSADAVAFRDIDPRAPTHVLVIPTTHVPAVRDARTEGGQAMMGRLLAFAADVATELGLDARGYRLVTNTGPDAGQSVDHVHFHLLGGRKMTWPPG
jgi:histidine triad (HIT) family protein